MKERIEDFWKVLSEIEPFETFWFSSDPYTKQPQGYSAEQCREKNEQVNKILRTLIIHIQNDLILTKFICLHCHLIGFDWVVNDQRFFLHLQDGGQFAMDLYGLFKSMLDLKDLKENLILIAEKEADVEKISPQKNIHSMAALEGQLEVPKMKTMRKRIEEFWSIIIDLDSLMHACGPGEEWKVASDLDQIVDCFNSDQKLKRFLEKNYPPFLKLGLDVVVGERALKEQRDDNFPIIMSATNSRNLRENLLEEADNADREDSREKPEELMPHIDMNRKNIKIPPRKETEPKSIEKSKEKPRMPKLSEHAKDLLLMTSANDRQKYDLKLWTMKFFMAFDELDLINEPFGRYLKWQAGTHIVLSGRMDTSLYKKKFKMPRYTYIGGVPIETIEEIEYKLFEFPNGAKTLFQFFFDIFPEIDNVDTEKISGIGFKNPFRLLKIKSIGNRDFCEHARECENSPKFHAEWERLKAEKTDKSKAGTEGLYEKGEAKDKKPLQTASKKIRWSAESFSKTVIGKIASNGVYNDEKSFRDFVDRKNREKGKTIIKSTKAPNKWLVNMDWICGERSDLKEKEILERLKAG